MPFRPQTNCKRHEVLRSAAVIIISAPDFWKRRKFKIRKKKRRFLLQQDRLCRAVRRTTQLRFSLHRPCNWSCAVLTLIASVCLCWEGLRGKDLTKPVHMLILSSGFWQLASIRKVAAICVRDSPKVRSEDEDEGEEFQRFRCSVR